MPRFPSTVELEQGLHEHQTSPRNAVKIDLTQLTDSQFQVMWAQLTTVAAAQDENHPVDILKRAFVADHLRRYGIGG